MDDREGHAARSTRKGRGSFTLELTCLWLWGVKEVTDPGVGNSLVRWWGCVCVRGCVCVCLGVAEESRWRA